MLNTLWRKWCTFLKLSFSDQVLVPVIWLMLGLARATVLLVPLRYFSSWLGVSTKTAVYTPVLLPSQINRAHSLGRLVRAAANITPWETVCFPQALVACWMLRIVGIPYTMHFGLAKSTDPFEKDPMKAHAWVTAGSIAVTGGRNNLFKYTVVGSFISPLLY